VRQKIAIIVAGGGSKRFGKKDKLLEPVGGFPLIYNTIRAFNDHPLITGVMIVASSANKKKIGEIVKKYNFPKVKKIVLGGETRFDSVEKGFKTLSKSAEGSKIAGEDIVLIHNGANPYVTEEKITACIKAIEKFGAAGVGKKVVDTIKEVKNGHIVHTHDRGRLAGMQTPQGATFQILKEAFNKVKKLKKQTPKLTFTDEASLIEALGLKVKLIPASENNFKVTTAADLEKMKHIFGEKPDDFLVGLGQDSHSFNNLPCRPTGKVGRQGRLANGGGVPAAMAAGSHHPPLILGGFEIKNHPKLKADSDGDVILHALYNAISQALGSGSLGHFATDLCKLKGVTDSKKYLKPLLTKMKRRGYKLNNIGIMLECARPKIDPLAPAIKKSLSRITGVPIHRIGITATSGEKLSPFGKGKAIQCFAIVSLRK